MAVEQAMTLEGFMTWLGTQEMKHEYDRGRVIPRIVAMAGGAESHNQAEANLFQEIANAFEDTRYRARTSGQLVTTTDGEVAYFPDAVLLDGPSVTIRYGTQHAAVNPVAVFEIASPSTRGYDEGRKLEVYKSIPTMREIVLLDSDRARAVRHFRVDDGWDLEEVVGLEASLNVLGKAIPLARIYRNVDLTRTVEE